MGYLLTILGRGIVLEQVREAAVAVAMAIVVVRGKTMNDSGPGGK